MYHEALHHKHVPAAELVPNAVTPSGVVSEGRSPQNYAGDGVVANEGWHE